MTFFLRFFFINVFPEHHESGWARSSPSLPKKKKKKNALCKEQSEILCCYSLAF